MKQSLRKTSSHLLLAYKYGETSASLSGRDFLLDIQGRLMTLQMDLTPNFHTRSKSAPSYVEGRALIENHHKLKFVQCDDNLMRARMIKAWERVEQPQLRMCLDLGARGQFLYSVLPHSLFTGGIQFDVLEQLALPQALQRAMAEDGSQSSQGTPA